MTLIKLKFATDTASGRVPAAGWLTCKPSRSRVVTGDPDTVVLPKGFPFSVPASGEADLELAPTGLDWCWEIQATGFGILSWTEYLVVPEPVPDPQNPGGFLPVDFTDLVRVDPRTLEPSAAPEPVWWAELIAAKALAVDVEAARDSAEASAAEAGVARDESVAASQAAGLSKVAASGSAVDAAASATSAGGYATSAAGSAQEASGSAAVAESARDLTVAAAGGSELSAAQANAAATASAQSSAAAEAAALDVVTRANNGEFQGEQGLPGNATMRIDTTVGTRVFITDGVTEKMIYGNTGKRSIAALLPPDWVANEVKIERSGGVVTLTLNLNVPAGLASTAPILSLPIGFRPSVAMAYLRQNSTEVYMGIDGSVRFNSSPGHLRSTVTYLTPEAWPSTLPGIPA